MRNEPPTGSLESTLRAAGLTEVGKVRPQNQDRFVFALEDGLFIVSDGMGGQQAGELASRAVVEVLPRLVKRHLAEVGSGGPREVEIALRDAVLALSQQLRDETVHEDGLSGMGATVVLAVIRDCSSPSTRTAATVDRLAHIAHMGDSRAYLSRAGELEQLTDDHSIIGILLRNGEITLEEAEGHPAKGQLSRYVGMTGEVYPDVRTVAIQEGDRLLLCTDGLTGMLPSEVIAALLAKRPTPQTACDALVGAANAAGGEDNITAVVIDC